MNSGTRLHVGGVAIVMLAMLGWAYWPGLSGPFLFDDDGNLNVLGAYGPIDSWRTLAYFLTSGNADPIGRPLSLLTFLIDAQSWPADPWPFKRTNLLLHLLNTALLGWVVWQLQAGLQMRFPVRAASPWTPLLAAGFWGAHPLFVSTTLYVVQREAMLPMTFLLLALLAWDQAVSRFHRQHIGAGWAWAILGFGTCTLLALLSKANGALTPLLVGLAYVACLRRPSSPSSAGKSQADRAAWLCLGIPSVLLLAYLMRIGIQLWSLPELAGRDWTLPQRLLSQPRALWSYMGQLALPRMGGGGVFVDNFAASRSWLEPATTWPAWLALVASIVVAVVLRSRFPRASFAWLFFLAGHLLESSVIPLELYFEHRNYLPAMFLGWPVAHTLLQPGAYARYRTALAILLLGAMLFLTHQRAQVWGNAALLGVLSATHESASARAQVNAAREEFESGLHAAALRRLDATRRDNPQSIDIAITAIGMECAALHRLSKSRLMHAADVLSHAQRWNYGLYDWLQSSVRNPALRKCDGFGLEGAKILAIAAESNPRTRSVPGRRREVWHVRGRIALAENRPRDALHWFDAALRLKPDPDYALVQAAALGEAGAPGLGVLHLDAYSRIESARAAEPVRDMFTLHAWLLRRDGYYRREMLHLRRALESEAKHRRQDSRQGSSP